MVTPEGGSGKGSCVRLWVDASGGTAQRDLRSLVTSCSEIVGGLRVSAVSRAAVADRAATREVVRGDQVVATSVGDGLPPCSRRMTAMFLV